MLRWRRISRRHHLYGCRMIETPSRNTRGSHADCCKGIAFCSTVTRSRRDPLTKREGVSTGCHVSCTGQKNAVTVTGRIVTALDTVEKENRASDETRSYDKASRDSADRQRSDIVGFSKRAEYSLYKRLLGFGTYSEKLKCGGQCFFLTMVIIWIPDDFISGPVGLISFIREISSYDV